MQENDNIDSGQSHVQSGPPCLTVHQWSLLLIIHFKMGKHGTDRYTIIHAINANIAAREAWNHLM